MRFLAVVAAVLALAACSTTGGLTGGITSARDATKVIVDGLCPAPVVADEQGSFMAGFFERYMTNRTNVELSVQDVKDIEVFKAICNKPLEARTDFDYGMLAGGAVDKITLMVQPYLGKDFYKVLTALGVVLK